jgi:hypothetical protein
MELSTTRLMQKLNAPSRQRLGAALILAAIGVTVFTVCLFGAERRAISHLPSTERAELYRAEFESFQTLCGRQPRKDALEKRCQERAEFGAPARSDFS